MIALKETMVRTIQQSCASEWRVGLYMNEVLIRIPQQQIPFTTQFNEVKEAVLGCIIGSYPLRLEDVTFVVMIGKKQGRFIICKTFVAREGLRKTILTVDDEKCL